jgi:acetyl esterase
MSTSTIPSDWSSLANINPEFKQLLSILPSPDWQLVTKTTTIETLRQMGAGRPESEKWPDVQELDLTILMRDGYENRIRVYNGKQENGPLLVMIHGGGCCLGDLTQEERNCRNWVRDRGGVAVSIEHRLAPEAKFPVPIEDCWDILQWVRHHLLS